MKLRNVHLKLLALAAGCVALGVGIGAITSAGAATGSSAVRPAAGAHARGGRRSRIFRRGVQGQLTIKTKSGWGTVSFERGTVVSLSGQQLTLREGTPKATYKTVMLTIPASARVRVNGQLGALSQVTAGQRAMVVTLPQRTLVIARTPKTTP